MAEDFRDIVSLVWILVKHVNEKVLAFKTRCRWENEIVVKNRMHALLDTGASEWDLASKHHVKENTEAPNVSFACVGFASDHLGGGVCGGSASGSFVWFVVFEKSGESEV